MITESEEYEALRKALNAYEEARKAALWRFERGPKARRLLERVAEAKRRLAESRRQEEAKA